MRQWFLDMNSNDRSFISCLGLIISLVGILLLIVVQLNLSNNLDLEEEKTRREIAIEEIKTERVVVCLKSESKCDLNIFH